MVRCPFCQAINAAGTARCPHCGRRIANLRLKTCPECGKQNLSNSRFCTCGFDFLKFDKSERRKPEIAIRPRRIQRMDREEISSPGGFLLLLLSSCLSIFIGMLPICMVAGGGFYFTNGIWGYVSSIFFVLFGSAIMLNSIGRQIARQRRNPDMLLHHVHRIE